MYGANPFGWPYYGQGYAGLINPVAPVGVGPGNGGETSSIQLAANGTSETPTLSSALSSTSTLLHLSGDSGLPSSGGFVLTIDSEVVYAVKIAAGVYRLRGRGVSNTTAASHSAGATATWGDSYDQAIRSTNIIGSSFTANVAGTGSTNYDGFLICFDSSQAYIGTDRYPMHVTSLLGVFDAGAGSGGTNRCDAAQPNAICTTAAVSDDCPAALSIPSRLTSNVAVGDTALVRYTNPEASVMTLGPRSAALQSWFGLARVDDSNVAAMSDPTANIIDGTVNGEWLNPSGIGINPDTGSATAFSVPYTSVTLPGSDRAFTHGGTPSPPNFGDTGWPMCALAVRHGTHRVPFWRSWDWHNFNYVYAGFTTDATFCQFVVNRNGNTNFGAVPSVDLPGSMDITGPDAVWDDGAYYFGASWYVAIYRTPYPVIGPSIGGDSTDIGGPSSGTGSVPSVDFSGGAGSPVITVPPAAEGGSGGGIPVPNARRQRFYATLV